MEVIWMEKNQPVRQEQEDAGKWVMDILISLFEDQTGEKYEYQLLSADAPKHHYDPRPGQT